MRACGEPYHRVTASSIDIVVVCPALAQLAPTDTVACVVKVCLPSCLSVLLAKLLILSVLLVPSSFAHSGYHSDRTAA